jgi:predicted peptidase
MAQASRPKTAATAPADGKFYAYPSDLKFEPGEEIKIDDPQTVKAGLSPTDADPTSHFTVYIPKDYDPARGFPVILNFHGMNSEANSWPFKDQTGGKGYIIVGMEYLRPACYKMDPNYDVGYTKRLLTWLKTNVNIDTKMVFLAGFSQGAGMWRGVISSPIRWRA